MSGGKSPRRMVRRSAPYACWCARPHGPSRGRRSLAPARLPPRPARSPPSILTFQLRRRPLALPSSLPVTPPHPFPLTVLRGRAQPFGLLRQGHLLRMLPPGLSSLAQDLKVSATPRLTWNDQTHASRPTRPALPIPLSTPAQRNPRGGSPRSCPFCKAGSYAISYSGPLSASVQQARQAEEQRIILMQIESQQREEKRCRRAHAAGSPRPLRTRTSSPRRPRPHRAPSQIPRAALGPHLQLRAALLGFRAR